MLKSIVKNGKIWSTCESLREIRRVGKVSKEIILNDNTEVMLIEKEMKPYGIAIRKADGKAFDFFALDRDVDNQVAKVYMKLSSYTPKTCSECKSETLDFRGLGIKTIDPSSFGKNSYEVIQSEFERIEYEDVIVSNNGNPSIVETILVQVTPEIGKKKLFVRYSDLKEDKNNYLKYISEAESIDSCCDSNREIEAFGKVMREIIFTYSFSVLLFEPRENIVSLAIKHDSAKQFVYYTSEDNNKEMIEKIYNRLIQVTPDVTNSKNKAYIDFRGLGA